MQDGNPKKNNQQTQNTSNAINAGGVPISIFEEQKVDIANKVSPHDSETSLDPFKTTIESIKINPNYNILDVMYNMDNINGPMLDGKPQGLRWRMRDDNNYYKQLYPDLNLTDEQINVYRDITNQWQEVYNNGTIVNYAKANANNLTDVARMVQHYRPDTKLTVTGHQSLGSVDPFYSAMNKYWYIDDNGETQSGRAVEVKDAPNGERVFSQSLTDIVPSPDGDGYVFKVIGKGKQPVNRITVSSFGNQMLYVPSGIFENVVNKGKGHYAYKNADGSDMFLEDVGYDEQGNLVTRNRFLGNQSGYTQEDVVKAMEIKSTLKNNKIDIAIKPLINKNYNVTKEGMQIEIPKQLLTTYRETESFGSYMTHAFAESYFQMGTWMGSLVFNNDKWDNRYYETLAREYQSPVGIDTSSPYYNRNIATMIGDQFAQLLPTIVIGALTGGVGAVLEKGAITLATQGAKVAAKKTIKEGVKRLIYLGIDGGSFTYEKSAAKSFVKKYIVNNINSLTWSSTAAGQSGWGAYEQGIQSGVNDSDAKMMSVIMAGITLVTSKLLEPSYIRPGMFVMLNKPIVNKTMNNLIEKMGLEVVMKEGKNKFIKNGIDRLMMSTQEKGITGWVIGRGLDASIEGIQEYSEQLGGGWSMGLYNRLDDDAYNKRVGEGRYDIQSQYDGLSSSFVLGAAMGLGSSVINPMSAINSYRASKVKQQKNEEYMLYNDFNNIGVDKVVRTAQESIIEKLQKGQIGRANYDVNGNLMQADENGVMQGETIDISNQPMAKFFKDGKLQTEGDVYAYNIIMEINREADIFNSIKSNKIIKDVDANTLLAIDEKNNIAINTAISYKELQQKQTRKKEIEEELNKPEITNDRQTQIQNELDILNEDDIYDNRTIAYSNNQYEQWTKPLSDIKRGDMDISRYKYSQKIKEGIINSVLTIDSYHIINALKNKIQIGENIKQDDIYSLLIDRPGVLFDKIHAYQDIFGEIDSVVKDRRTGQLEYYGLGKFVRDHNNKTINNKYSDEQLGSIKSNLLNLEGIFNDKFNIDKFENVLSGIDNELKTIFESIGDTNTFGELLSLTGDREGISKEISKSLNNILSSIGKIDYEIDDNTDADSMAIAESQKNAFKNKYSPLIEGINTVKDNSSYLNETIDIDVLNGEYAQGNKGKNQKKAIEVIFKRVLDTINGDMYISSFVNNPSEIPPMFRDSTIGGFMNFLEENKTNPLDVNTMDDISMTMNIVQEHISSSKAYLWALEALENRKDNELIRQGHTYDNEITKRLLKEKNNIHNKQQKDIDLMDAMIQNMIKNGYTREKDNMRYLSAQICNNDLYLRTIGEDNHVPFLDKLFYQKNGKFSVNEKAEGLEGIVAKRINEYLSKYPEQERNDILSSFNDDVLTVHKVYQEYKQSIIDMMNKFYGNVPTHEDVNIEYQHSINEVAIELERMFQNNIENKKEKIDEYKAFMNNLNALQWETRNKLSGKLKVFILFNEAVAINNNVTYNFLNEHDGKKLYVAGNSTSMDNNTIYRGTYSPADMEIGKSVLFDSTVDIVKMNYAELQQYVDRYKLDIDNTLPEEDLRKEIIEYNDENKIQRRNNALHLLMTNLSIDNYMGGDNLSVNDIFTIIKEYSKKNIFKDFNEADRNILEQQIVYDGHRIDIEKTINNISEYLKNYNDVDLKNKAESIFQSIRKNMNIEQEYALIQMIANYYRNENGEFELGLNIPKEDAFKMFKNSICVIGGGGTGKSTMIMENYYNIIKTILSKTITNKDNKIVPDNKKPRILTVSPTHELNRLQSINIDNAFGDNVEHNNSLFQDIDNISENYDIIVIDEASLIENKNNKGKGINRQSFKEMLERVQPKQVIFLYDTNQTINTKDRSLSKITSLLGERTIPLQTRYRTGYTDMNSLVEFFTNNDFIEHNDNTLPKMFRGDNPIRTRYKRINIDDNYYMQGIRFSDNEKDIIDDYFEMKKFSTNNMIVVRTALEKERIVNARKVDANDVYILEYGDPNYNVSGRGSKNVFVLMDYNSVLATATTDSERNFALTMLSKWYNTAITRLQGEGYIAIQYANGNEHSIKIKDSDILPKYNDVVNFDNAIDKDDMINIFNRQSIVELNERNSNLDRLNAIDSVFPEKKITVDNADKDVIIPEKQHVYENITNKVKNDIVKLTKEKANNNSVDISNLIYKNVKDINDYSRKVNDLLRYGLKYIFDNYLSGKIDINEIKDINHSNVIFNKIIDSYKKYIKDSTVNIDELLKDDNQFFTYFHNLVINTITSSGLEVMASLRANTTIVSPTLNTTINGEEYTTEPLMINAVGYTNENGKDIPIFDVYLTDFSREERDDNNNISSANMKKAIYTIGVLAQRGYKINNIHFLNYILSNTKKWVDLGFAKDIIINQEIMMGNPDYISIISSMVKPEEVFAEKDSLLKIGIKAPMDNAERNGKYIDKDKNVVLIKGKVLKMTNGEVKTFYVLNNGSMIEKNDFSKTYSIETINERSRLNRGAIENNTIFSPIRGIPVSEVNEDLETTRDKFYKHRFFKEAKERINNVKIGDKVTSEYIDNMDLYIFNGNEPQKTNYKNIVLFKIDGNIVGIQERITYGTEDISNDTIDTMITEYVNGKDNLDDIRKALIEIDKDINEGIYKDSNIAYQIEKIKTMRVVKNNNSESIVTSKNAGTVIISERDNHSFSSLLSKLDYKGSISWGYNTSMQFGLYATINIDGRNSIVYVDAQKVDLDYVNSLREQLSFIKKRYSEMIKDSSFNIKELRKLLEDNEIIDFLYANKDKINLEITNSDFIDLKTNNKERKEIFGKYITEIQIALEYAEESINGDMKQAFNKAIFKESKNKSLSSTNVYVNNLITNVQGISNPSINISINNKLSNSGSSENPNKIQPKGTINVYWGQAESNTSTKILSNLAPRKFSWEGREYGSVEHAYQSNKSGTFDKATYDAYNNIGGYGRKIRGKGTVAEMKAADSLGLMKRLVVESFKQNPNSDAAKKLLQYENFTHNTNELIDKAFLEGLKLAQQELLNTNENNAPKENIKGGVPKLFESNSKLANSVYEALGFSYSPLTNEDKIKIDNRAKEEVAVFNKLHALTKKNNFNKAYHALVDKIIEAGKDINRREEYIELLNFQEYINNYYEYLINDINDKTAKDTKITDSINEIKEQAEKDKNKRKRNKITLQQKQNAQEQYSQYLESLNKPNTNPVLQSNQQEQVKKFAELQERLNNKEFIEGAKNAFESSKGLQEWGTQEQYNDYIARVSLGIVKNPTSGEYNYYSKVKDIVYRGTSSPDRFDKNEIGSIDNASVFGKGFYFSERKRSAEKHNKSVFPYLVNVINPIEVAFTDNDKGISVSDAKQKLYNKELPINNDSVIVNETGQKEEIVIKEIEQIHRLGTKQDIEGFKEFVSNNPTSKESLQVETSQLNSGSSEKPNNQSEQQKINIERKKSSKGKVKFKEVTDDYVTVMRGGIDVEVAQVEVARIIGDAMASNGFKTNPNLISNDKRLYGMLKDKMIILAELDGKVHPTAARHESMHYILDYCLSPDDFKNVTNAAIRTLNNQYKAQNNNTTATLSDAMEYLCNGFETFRIKPKTRLKTIFDKIYNAIYRLIKGYERNSVLIDNLYNNAETGVYATENNAIYDNNIDGIERYKVVDNEYTKHEAIANLYDLYEDKSDIVKITKDVYNQLLLERVSSIGKYISDSKSISNRLSELYFNLTNKDNYDFINNTIIPSLKMSLGKYIDKNGISNTFDVIKTIQSNDVLDKNIISKVENIFSIPDIDIEEALNWLSLSYMLMKEYYNDNEKPLNTYIQLIDNSIDIQRIVSNVNKFRDNKNNINASSYQHSYDKSTNINDWVNLRYRDVINNIRYTNGKYEKNVTWEEYSTMMFEIARKFHFNDGNQYRDKMNLSYKEIMDIVKSKIKSSREGKATIESIYNFFGYKEYDNNNENSIQQLVAQEYEEETGNINFIGDGYGYIMDRLNDYLDENSITNRIFKEKAGENYSELYDRLKERQRNIQCNIINYTVNYFNSLAKRDIYVANTNKKVTVKVSDNTLMASKMFDKIIKNSLFKIDNEGNIEGVSDLSKEIAEAYTIKDDNILVHKLSNTEINLNNNLSGKETVIVYEFLNKFYQNYINDIESIYEKRDNGYHLTSQIINNISSIINNIENNLLVGKKDSKAEYKNTISNKWITKINTDNYIMTSTEMMKNASGEYVSPMAIRTNLMTMFGYGTSKYKTAFNDISIFKQNDEILNPFLSGDISLLDMPEISGMENKYTGRKWDEMTKADRIDCFFNKLMIKEDKYFNILVSHTGDRKTTNMVTLEKDNPFYFINEKKTMPNINHIGKVVKQLMLFHRKIYNESQARLKTANITFKGDELLYNGNPVELYTIIEQGTEQTYVTTADANYILGNLKQNIDYTIKNNKFYKGNAGNNKIFGITKTKLESNNDYYKYFNKQIAEQKQLFYDMLKKYNFKPNNNIKEYVKGETNMLLDAYYTTHILVNEGISNLMTGTTDYANSDEDYIKRSMGYTAPTNFVKGDPNSIVPNIGNTTRFALMQDLPGGNSLFGGINYKLSTDGIVLYPMFYRTALRNSAGGEMSFIGNGANKTVNHHYDLRTGQLHYMKCSEMCVNYNMYRKNLGQEVYKSSLDHDVMIIENDMLVSINLYNVFKEMIKDINVSRDANRYFEDANNKFLDYLWNTKIYENGKEIGRAYDAIVHKIIFQSALKIGQEKVNYWSKDENNRYTFPSNKNLMIQEVSNDNYGIQQNKLQSTQSQDKTVMAQLIKLIGAFANNKDVYNNIINSLNNIAEAKLKELNFQDDDTRLMYYKNKMKSVLVNNYDTRKKNAIDNSKTLEQVKQDILNYIFNDIEDVIKPSINGNMYVQEPAFTYFKNEKEIPLKSFRYIGEGIEYNDKKQLVSDIKEGKNISIGLQECIMAFPHQQEFGISEDSTLEQAFSFFGYDLYATSEDYELRNNKLQLKQDKVQEIKDSILKGIKSGYEIKVGDVYYDINENKYLYSKQENINTDNIYDINILLRNSGMPNSIKNKIIKQLKDVDANETIKQRLNKIANVIITYYMNLNDACNCYALRIPTTNTSSGFPTRIVEFDNTIDNTILINPAKSLLDGSDFDIDELNVYFPSLSHSMLSNNLIGSDKFKNDFFDAILSYYGDLQNVDSILSSITTKNLKHATADIEQAKHYINTPNHMIENQDIQYTGSKLVGYLVNIQNSVSHIMSTLNNTDSEFKNKYHLFTNDIIKRQFNDVCTELINGATDNAGLGGAIGKLRISTINTNMISGILMNMENPTLFNSLLEYKKDNNVGYNENMMLSEYGLIKQDKIGYIRDETKDINLSVRYLIDIFKMLSSNETLTNIYDDIEESQRLSSFGKKSTLLSKLESLTYKNDLLKSLYDFTVQGEALYMYNTMLIDSINHQTNDIINLLNNIGKTLGISETKEGNVITKSLSESIIEYLDNINKKDENGNIINKEINYNIISNRYSMPKNRIEKLYDAIDFRGLLSNDKYLQNKIRMIAIAENIKNDMFVTEKLASTIMNHVVIDNKLTYVDTNKIKALQKEIDRIYTGNLINKIDNTIISFNNVDYDLKTEGRVKFQRIFPKILDDMKMLFDKENMFLNYMKAIPMLNDIYYGVNKLKYFNESEKENLRRSYDKMYQEAKFDMLEKDYDTLSEEAKIRVDKIRNGVRAIEFMNILQQGYYGNSVDISAILKPYIGIELNNKESEIRKDIEILINNIQNNKDDSVYRYVSMRIGLANNAIGYNAMNNSYSVNMKSPEKTYTMTTNSNANDENIIYINNQSYVNPWGNHYNMYGANGNITPLLTGDNKTLRYISKRLLQESIEGNSIVLSREESDRLYIGSNMVNGDMKINPQEGDMVLIGNRSYEVTKENNKYVLKPILTQSNDSNNKQYAKDTTMNKIVNIASKSQIEIFTKHIQKVFPNVKINYVFNDADIAYIQNGEVYINMNKVSSDSYVHELGHVFTLIMKNVNPKAYNVLCNEAQQHIDNNSPIVRYIKSKYHDLSNDDMIYEVISNTIQLQQAENVNAFLLQQNATNEEKTLFVKLWDSVKRFFSSVSKILDKLIGGNWEKLDTMTIEDMGKILMDAIANGKTLSYLTSEQVSSIYSNRLNTVSNTMPIKTSKDFINNLIEYQNKFSDKTDDEITDILYNSVIVNNNKILYGNIEYDFSGLSADNIKLKIKERIIPFISENMPSQKENIIKAIKNNKYDVIDSIRFQLGANESGKPYYSLDSCVKLSKILQIDKTKKYYTLEELIGSDILKEHKEAFDKLKDISGFNPIVSIEYQDEKSMTVSLYDFTKKNLNFVDGTIGKKNIMAKYGIIDNHASVLGITLGNNEFDVRALMLTVMTNILQKNGVKVRDVSVTKLNFGDDSDSVVSKRVDMTEMNHNISILNGIKEFSNLIENETIKEVFNTPNDKLSTNDINYWELLSSLYHDYYVTPDKGYDTENRYEPMIRDNYDNINLGKITLEQKLNLINWRLKQLSNIPTQNMKDYEINESRILLEALKTLQSSSRVIHQFSKKSALNSLNKLWNTFDVDSEEVQFIRGIITQNTNKIVYDVRKKKEDMYDIWKHFVDEHGGVKKYTSNPYFMFKDLYATLKTKDNKEAFAGRILWTVDDKLDNEFATQARQKIQEGKLSNKDLEMASKICDAIEETYIEIFKHEQWMKHGTEEVMVSTGIRKADGKIKYDPKTLTKEEWLQKLYNRGYKRGMIPIMQKNYIDGAKSFVKRMGLEFSYSSNEYKDASSELFNQENSDKTIDDITHIFMDQLSDVDIDLKTQNENNFSVKVDNNYGYIKRNKYLGLLRDSNTGNILFNEMNGEQTNGNINKDLEFVFNFFNLVMKRKSIHEKSTIPVINEAVKLLEIGKAFSIDKSTDAIVDVIRNLAEMCVKGSSYKIKNFGPKINGSSVGEILTTASKGYVGAQMFINMNVAINSAFINILKATVEKVSGDTFVGKHLYGSYGYVMKHMSTSYKMASDLGIIRQTEYDTHSPGYKGAVSNKSLLTSFTSNILNWGTDSYSRTSAMIAKMTNDGILNAYKDGKYDDTKDMRFFNKDGSQTDKQLLFYTKMKELHRLQGIDIMVDDKGNEHLTRPYTFDESNAIKEWADKRILGGYDNTSKSVLANYVLGRMALQYFNWFPAALKGFIGGSMNHDTIFSYQMNDEGVLYKDLYFSEGTLTTLINIGRRSWKAKDIAFWNHINNTTEKQNLKRLFTTIGLGVMLKLIFNFLFIDDDDEDDKYGVVPEYRIFKNIEYAADGLYSFMYKDALQRLWHPFVLTDNIANIFDKGKGNLNINRMINTTGIGNNANTMTEVITGETINDIIE